MIKIGDMVIDPKRDLTPEQAKSLKEFLVSQRVRQGLNVDGSEDHINSMAQKSEPTLIEEDVLDESKIEKSKVNTWKQMLVITNKKIVTFFTLIYLLILMFVPIKIPKGGIDFVPFFTIGERTNPIFIGYGYTSYVKKLDIYMLLMEVVIVSIIFAWSLYFFKKVNRGE